MRGKGFRAIIQLDAGISRGKAGLGRIPNSHWFEEGYKIGVEIYNLEQYDKGFDHGLASMPCRPTSLAYVDGYEHGRRVSKIGQESDREPGRSPRKGEIGLPFDFFDPV